MRIKRFNELIKESVFDKDMEDLITEVEIYFGKLARGPQSPWIPMRVMSSGDKYVFLLESEEGGHFKTVLIDSPIASIENGEDFNIIEEYNSDDLSKYMYEGGFETVWEFREN